MIELEGSKPNFRGFPIFKVGEPERPNDGYSIQAFGFCIGTANGDGALFDIKPGESSQVITVIKEHKAWDTLESGWGWVVIHRKEEDRVEVVKTTDLEEGSVAGFKTGDSMTIIAGPRGLKIVEVCTPPFEPSTDNTQGTEIIVDIDSKSLPDEFWAAFHRLKATKTE